MAESTEQLMEEIRDKLSTIESSSLLTTELAEHVAAAAYLSQMMRSARTINRSGAEPTKKNG